jgi:hypothetical protein
VACAPAVKARERCDDHLACDGMTRARLDGYEDFNTSGWCVRSLLGRKEGRWKGCKISHVNLENMLVWKEGWHWHWPWL